MADFDLAAFRAEFAAFATRADDAVNARGADAERLAGRLSARAVRLATAHLLALDEDAPPSSADGGAGVVVSESVGPRSVSYMPTASSGAEAWWAQTVYGREFLELRRASPAAFMPRAF